MAGYGDDGIFTDSAGNRARYTPIEEVAAGDAICAGWKPWPVVQSVDVDDASQTARLIFEHGHHGGWAPLGEFVPVEQPSSS